MESQVTPSKTNDFQAVQPGYRLSQRISDELTKIQNALNDKNTSPEHWGQLYVAQQAAIWVINGDRAAAPYDVIMNGKVQPPTSA